VSIDAPYPATQHGECDATSSADPDRIETPHSGRGGRTSVSAAKIDGFQQRGTFAGMIAEPQGKWMIVRDS
jgi:hypothetical protein